LQPCIEAYLDIETTGLSPRYSEITVVGIHICIEYLKQRLGRAQK